MVSNDTLKAQNQFKNVRKSIFHFRALFSSLLDLVCFPHHCGLAMARIVEKLKIPPLVM